ncbi:MAG TPA: DUF1684 domain-containing protein [Chryseolinea sp.]|nr:DUF1684 domain-containing protein [Chryseolinea sp.]
MFRSILPVALAFTFLSGCTTKSGYSREELSQYEQEINAWHTHRLQQVKAQDGWLNLLGLYWLETGINTFGSGANNQVVFPDSTLEEQAGYFLVEHDHVEMQLNQDTRAMIKRKPVRNETIFYADSIKQPQVENDRIAWTIIRRDGKFGVRVRDLTMQAVKNFRGVERFPIDPEYRVEATFVPAEGRTIDITNVLGQTTSQNSPGTLVFTWKGAEQTLDVLEGGKEEYFVIIADETSGKETYAGGRYLYVKHADERGKVVLDFNKTYNPPCVFTPYATCPLPPHQNILPFRVLAGEKVYNHDLSPTAERATASLKCLALVL